MGIGVERTKEQMAALSRPIEEFETELHNGGDITQKGLSAALSSMITLWDRSNPDCDYAQLAAQIGTAAHYGRIKIGTPDRELLNMLRMTHVEMITSFRNDPKYAPDIDLTALNRDIDQQGLEAINFNTVVRLASDGLKLLMTQAYANTDPVNYRV